MKKLLLFAAVALSIGQLSAQKNAYRKVDPSVVAQAAKINEVNYSERQQLLEINVNSLKQVLAGTTNRTSGQAGVVVEFPTIEGGFEKFRVWENSNFEPALQAQYPDIRAYVGTSLTTGASIHFSVSPLGLQTMLLRPDRTAEFIEAYTADRATYVLFDSATRLKNKLPFNCSTVDAQLTDDLVNEAGITNRSNNQSYKTMRLALSCTGEYGAYFGSVANAIAGMNATMTRVNGVMEIDLSLHLNMIANNNLIVYTNAANDPYSPASGMDAWNLQLQNNLTSVIGSANYDIGHLFGATGGGGNAGCIGCVCEDPSGANDEAKGSGYTSPSNGIPSGDTFDIDYVIHEMGHQLGANHTFSHATEGSGVNVEPGSGSTIMAYAGITDYNVQEHSDAYFTYRSILQIQNNLAGKTCPISTAVTNTPPTVNAGADFSIPSGTAYILKGVVSDAEGDTLNYCWEQNNSAGNSVTGENSQCYPTKATGPNYRSFLPQNTPNRFMPQYNRVLNGELSWQWESVSTIARQLRFTLTVRDNHAAGNGWQTNTDEVTVTSMAPYNGTTGAGPFAVTSQNTTGVAWGAAGTNQTITWSVNNTTSLPGSANVNIKLSLDNGVTWPITLASNTPNDGSEVITVPAATATQCRIWIEPTGNNYYAVNSTPFAVGYEYVNVCNTYNFNTPFTLPNTGAATYTVKTLNVTNTGLISDVNFSVNATHSNLQNLTIAVIRPNGGTLYPLFQQQCTGTANMNVTFDAQGSTFDCFNLNSGSSVKTPVGDLGSAAFINQNPTGNWQFGFRDTVAGPDSGTINSFSLEVCTAQLQPLGTQQFAFENFALYPNPNNGSFKVQFDATAGNQVDILVHDISGRAIFERAYNNTGLFAEEIQLTNAQAGVYMVTVSNGNQKIVKKIVVE
ncbi:zinc-dependent metalloprotease [Flavobacterium caeni]|uniref:Por secretion system C-terminal sorting domain-containing protein n=1 Tax=Flavobacterium caeni TaxID=490189 RepID=A0A1G5ED76_9FLAO|nr:zinc-dependent metalloprotease family protein [Flavobacterium caeni]SCY24922.1 Por secretion system C-terminal sorting domain-containing protein [Flavobacterium caeni]